jgi:subtilisin family serine protease
MRVAAVAVLATLLAAAPAAAFTPTDPLAARQWYLQQDHAFDAWPDAPPPATIFSPVKVAIVDSGIDGGHPDFQDKVVLAKSFVGGSPYVDQEGHGTFGAGEIAATLDGQGIVGMAYPVELMIAKVVRQDGTIPLSAEAAAIRWAAANGAQVINLSLGGVRDPRNPVRDTYSKLEQDAVEYAYQKGAVLVAAVGNADEADSPAPWPFASYPAALPHVIGVSALSRLGAVPAFSNRDAIYNDISAPGQDIFSTFPRALTAEHVGCVDQGYSDCGSDDYRHAEGTSFAAPQVSAAAAMLLALNPALRPDQVGYLLEHTADDVNASNGCRTCPLGRDSFSGWGRLDVAKAIAALSGPLPQADRYESNDDAGRNAYPISGPVGSIKATVDFWDDQVDVYKLRLAKGQRLAARLEGPENFNVDLILWKPGTVRVNDLRSQRLRAAQSVKPGSLEQLDYRAGSTGWYYLEVKITTPGFGPYTLDFTKT